MKLYIAGPMSQLPEFNYPAFMDAERQLVASGYEVENPARPGQVDGWTWRDYMKRGIRQMLDCEGVALLPGWQHSRGAQIEAALATQFGMRLWSVDMWEQAAHRRRLADHARGDGLTAGADSSPNKTAAKLEGDR